MFKKDPVAARFIREVTSQVGRALGGGDVDGVLREEVAVTRLMTAAEHGGAGLDDPVGMLMGSPPLLAAVFQNIDLLYLADDPRAEVIGRWIMEAVGRAQSERPS